MLNYFIKAVVYAELKNIGIYTLFIEVASYISNCQIGVNKPGVQGYQGNVNIVIHDYPP